MIDFTIKTLESVNHQFSVEDETTVAQLKEKIRLEMGIEINMQRLIFCGRVLGDEQKLAEFDVNGKVIHLVPRPPPSPQSRTFAHNPRQEMREAIHEAHRVIDRMITQPTVRQPPLRNWAWDPPSALVADQQRALSMTPVANRLDFIRRALDDIRISLIFLEQLQNERRGSSGDLMDFEFSSPEPELPMTPPRCRNRREQMAEDTGEDSTESTERLSSRRRPLRPTPRIMTMPRDLAALLEDLDRLRDQFSPYRAAYLAILRDTETQHLSVGECARRHVLVELCCNVMHSISHALHAASDIELTVGNVTRLSAGFSATRQIPVQAHINVVHTPRTENAGQNVNRGASGVASFSAYRAQRMNGADLNTSASSHTAGAPNTGPVPDGQGQGSPGRNTAAAATEPSITYQVEIETRVPIAVPIAAEFINALGAVATGYGLRHNHPEQGQEQSQPQTQPQAQAQGQNQSAQPQFGQDPTQPQAAQPRAIQDIESLLRTLTNAHSDVDFVMSMEDLHPIATGIGGPEFNTTILSQASAGNTTAGLPPSATVTGATFGPFGFTLETSGPDLGIDSQTGGSAGARTGGNTGASGRGGASLVVDGGPDGHGHSIRYGPSLSSSRFGMSGFGGAIGFDSDGVPFAAGVTNTGPTTFSLQPNGPGVLFTPMDTYQSATGTNSATEVFNSMFTLFRPMDSTTPNVAPQTTGGNAGQTATAANTMPSFTPASNTGNQNSANRVLEGVWGIGAYTAPTNTASATATMPSFTPSSNTGNQNTATRTLDAIWGIGASAAPSSGANAATGSNPMPSFTPAPSTNTTSQNTPGRAGEGTWGTSVNVSVPGQELPSVVYVNNALPGQRAADPRRRPRIAAGERPRTNQTNARAHQLAMACMVYDRFLNCDSIHARRHVSERRAAYQELHNEQMRQRAARRTGPSIYRLEERNDNFTTRHMAIMMRLLSGPAMPEARLNAFMVSVARVLFLEQNGRPRPHDPLCMPREFVSVRSHMREYLQRAIETVMINSGSFSLFDRVANLIISHHQPFIDRMSEFTEIESETDMIQHLRDFLRTRLPAIIACVMSGSPSDAFVARFYAVFARFYTDLCVLVMQFCIHGYNGLTVLYTAFINDLTMNYEETAQEWIRLVSSENLLAIQGAIDPYASNYISRMRRMIPVTPPLPPPRNDTPDTIESLPSTSIPTMSSSSSASDSPPPPEPEDNDPEGSPPLEDADESIADTASITSHNSIPRSPVQTRSVATSPRHETPQPPSPTLACRNARSIGQSGQSGPSKRLSNLGGPSTHGGQASQQQAGQSSQSGTTSLTGQCTQIGEDEQIGQDTRASHSEHGPVIEPPQVSSVPSSPPPMRPHWDEQWIPVFNRDQRIQRERERDPQEPFSDAYLCGMPLRKRRCVRAARPPTTLDGFINEGVRAATDQPAQLDAPEVRLRLLDSVRTILRTRADNSADYDPLRFTATARFLDNPIPNDREPDSKTEEPTEGKRE